MHRFPLKCYREQGCRCPVPAWEEGFGWYPRSGLLLSPLCLDHPLTNHMHQMETFAVAEDADSTVSPQKVHDIEDGEISGEYKRPPY